ncbi:hypothetical protein Dimus_026762 [Dionaea muscipula]
MAGRTRGYFQKRVRDAADIGCDSRSPDRFLAMGRGSSSPGPPRFRRAPPSPGIRPIRNHRSPSPIPSSSPDPEAMSSSEDGDSSVVAVTSSEAEDNSKLEVGNLDSSPFHLLSSIPKEIDKLEGFSSAVVSGSTTISPAKAVLLCQAAIDGDGHDDGRLVSARCGSVSSIPHLDLGYASSVNGGVNQTLLLSSELVVGEDGEGVGSPLKGAGLEVVDDVLCPEASIGEGLGLATSSVVVETHKAAIIHVDDARPVAETGHVGSARPVAVASKCGPTLPLFCGSVGLGDGGSVSEEVRVASVAREALRSQPTDGLRQPPLSPTVPESGAEGGVGMDGTSGCRSYAHVVQLLGFFDSLSVDQSKSLGFEPVFFLIRMVGRRRDFHQRRVREVGFDSRSPDPHTASLTRGSPSPTDPHYRRPPPSPGLRNRHQRSPSPVLTSSPDLGECSSTEEEGVSPVVALAAPKEDVLSVVAFGSRFSPLLVNSCSSQEVNTLLEGSISEMSSGSSTISPATAVLLCQVPTVADAHLDDRTTLVRSDLGSSISSPALVCASEVSVGEGQVVAVRDGEQGGDESMGDACLPSSTVSLPCSASPECVDHRDSAPLAMGERLTSTVGSDAMTFHRVFPCSSAGISCVHQLPLLNGLGGLVDGGSVSEEVRVTSAAREALGSQPTDGLRQPPSSPAVPVRGAEFGGDIGCDSRSPDRFLAMGRGSPSPGPPRFRRAPPSPGIRPFRHHRSPSPIPSSSPDPEVVSSSEDGDSSGVAVTSSEAEDISDLEVGNLDSSPFYLLSSIPEEIDKLEGSSSAVVSGSSTISPATALLLGHAAIDGDGHDDGRLVSARCGSVSSIPPLDLGYASTMTGGVNQTLLLSSELVVGEDGEGVGSPLKGVGLEVVDDVLCTEASIGEGLGLATSTVVVEIHKVAIFHVDEARPVAKTVHDCDARPVAVVSTCSPTLPLFCGSVGLGDGGSVSEEVRVASVARKALRSQPTDGLRQPPSSPTVPESGDEGGVEMDDTSGCRSYAHVVQVDRREDVVLSYIPPTDGGNTIIMEDSDGDRS